MVSWLHSSIVPAGGFAAGGFAAGEFVDAAADRLLAWSLLITGKKQAAGSRWGNALEHRFGEDGWPYCVSPAVGRIAALAFFKGHLVLSWLRIQSRSGRRIADMKKPRRGFPPGAHFVSFNFLNRSFR
jgi:hypothetical protein